MIKRRKFLNKNKKNNSNSIINPIVNNFPRKYEPTTFYPTATEKFINILSDINNFKFNEKNKIIEPLDISQSTQNNFINNHSYIFPMGEYYKNKTCYLGSNPINAGRTVTNSSGQSGDGLYFSSYTNHLSYLGDNTIIIEIKFSDVMNDGNKDNIRINSITFYKDLSLSNRYDFNLEGDSADNDKISSFNTFGYLNATGNFSKWTIRTENSNNMNFDINNDGMNEQVPKDKYPITFTFDSDNNKIKLEIDKTRNEEMSQHVFEIITHTEAKNNNIPVPYNYEEEHHHDRNNIPVTHHRDHTHHISVPHHNGDRHHEEKHHIPVPYHHEDRHHKSHKDKHNMPFPFNHEDKHHKDRHQEDKHHEDRHNIPVPYNQEDEEKLNDDRHHDEKHIEYVPIPYNEINETIPNYEFNKSSNILNNTPLPLNLDNNIQNTVPSYLDNLSTIIIHFDMYMSDLTTDEIFKLKNTICIETLQELDMCSNIEFLNNNIRFMETFNTNEKLKLLIKVKDIDNKKMIGNNLVNKFTKMGINVIKIDIY